MTLNRISFPRLADYLDALPEQLESHPKALTKADFSLILRPQLASFITDSFLPSSIRRALNAPWKQGEWIPATAYVALCAIARDQLWQTDEAYHKGMFAVATEMYKGPVYKTLFFMFGPSLVALSAAKRWETLHQGTKLAIKKQQKESLNLVLQYPKRLFNEVSVQSLGAAFCAIAEGSRGKNSKSTFVNFSETEAEILIEWNYG